MSTASCNTDIFHTANEKYSLIYSFPTPSILSWKTAEKWFLDALEKIKAIGNEVFFLVLS